jgi:hypothetical protein
LVVPLKSSLKMTSAAGVELVAAGDGEGVGAVVGVSVGEVVGSTVGAVVGAAVTDGGAGDGVAGLGDVLTETHPTSRRTEATGSHADRMVRL